MKRIHSLIAIFAVILINFNLTYTQSSSILPYPVIQAINKLKSGNERFVKGKMNIVDHVQTREELIKGQEPYAVIVTCSDSRVAPEYIFDSPLGSLFVIRTAGNVVDEIALGSIEYAIEHLKSKVIVVMGHESCGAVKASIGGKTPSENINSIIDKIEPSVKKSKAKKISKDDQVKFVTDENVKEQIDYIVNNSEIVSEFLHENKIAIMGGYYNFKNGMVDFIDAEINKIHSEKKGKSKKPDNKKEIKKEHKHK